MRWSERRTAVRSTFEMTSTLSLRAARALVRRRSSCVSLDLMTPQSVTIYMPLLNEGTDCWRPVSATPVEGDRYRIDEQGYNRDDEEWQFPPGSIVRCHLHYFF